MEYLRKTAFGYSLSREETDYIFYTKEEVGIIRNGLNDAKEKIDALSKANSDLVEKYNGLVSGYNDLQKSNRTYEGELDSLYKELENSEEEHKEYEKLCSSFEKLETENRKLSAIIKDRANADRRIVPKKQHTGYVFISSSPEEYRYKENGMWKSVNLFKTVFQTPYNIDLDYDMAEKKCISDFIEGSAFGSLAGYLGLSTVCDPVENYESSLDAARKYITDNFELDSEYMMSEEDVRELREEFEEENRLSNIMISPKIKYNGQTEYYEFSFKHYLPLERIPDNMRIPKRRKTNKTSSK